jgi:NADH:ubiquinone oxidoreductase subunit E
MTWNQQTEARAAAILSRYPEPRSAVMPLLYLAMDDEGHLTNDGQRRVAELTGLTAAQVQSVGSFYTMYKDRVGAYLISVCTSISCMLLGGDDVLDAIADETDVPDGETGDDDIFSVEHAECIGACGGAPSVQVNYELIEGVTPEQGRSLCRWLREERPSTVLGDDMQERFGGQRSFEWGPKETEGATGPVPAFGPLGTTGEGS